MLSFTPPERLTDSQNRPYFLWDCDLTVDQFRKGLEDPDPEVRAYLVGKLMRQAKPDDVFLFVRPREIRALWPSLTRYLGRTREFWTWLFETWERQGDLDLFWRNRGELGPLVADALGALRASALQAEALRTAPAFAELRVSDGSEACVVDLVASLLDPSPHLRKRPSTALASRSTGDTRSSRPSSPRCSNDRRFETSWTSRPSWPLGAISKQRCATLRRRTPASHL